MLIHRPIIYLTARRRGMQDADTQQAQHDLRSTCEDREPLGRFESVNEELTELTNEQGKLHADI